MPPSPMFLNAEYKANGGSSNSMSDRDFRRKQHAFALKWIKTTFTNFHNATENDLRCKMHITLERLDPVSITSSETVQKLVIRKTEPKSVFVIAESKTAHVYEVDLATGYQRSVGSLQKHLRNAVAFNCSQNGNQIVWLLPDGKVLMYSLETKVVSECVNKLDFMNTWHEPSIDSIDKSKLENECNISITDDARKIFVVVGKAIHVGEMDYVYEYSDVHRSFFSTGMWSLVDCVYDFDEPIGTFFKDDRFCEHQNLYLCCFVGLTDDNLHIFILRLKWSTKSGGNYTAVKDYIPCSLPGIKKNEHCIARFSRDGKLLAVAINFGGKTLPTVAYFGVDTKYPHFVNFGNGQFEFFKESSCLISDIMWSPNDTFVVCIFKEGFLCFLKKCGHAVLISSTSSSPAHTLKVHDSKSVGDSTQDPYPGLGKFTLFWTDVQPTLVCSSGHLIYPFRLPFWVLRPLNVSEILLLEAELYLKFLKGNGTHLDTNLKSDDSSLPKKSIISRLLACMKGIPKSYPRVAYFIKYVILSIQKKLIPNYEENQIYHRFPDLTEDCILSIVLPSISTVVQAHSGNHSNMDALSIVFNDIFENMIVAWIMVNTEDVCGKNWQFLSSKIVEELINLCNFECESQKLSLHKAQAISTTYATFLDRTNCLIPTAHMISYTLMLLDKIVEIITSVCASEPRWTLKFKLLLKEFRCIKLSEKILGMYKLPINENIPSNVMVDFAVHKQQSVCISDDQGAVVLPSAPYMLAYRMVTFWRNLLVKLKYWYEACKDNMTCEDLVDKCDECIKFLTEKLKESADLNVPTCRQEAELMYANGNVKEAVHMWLVEIERLMKKQDLTKVELKTLIILQHSVLYSCVFMKKLFGMSLFIDWVLFFHASKMNGTNSGDEILSANEESYMNTLRPDVDILLLSVARIIATYCASLPVCISSPLKVRLQTSLLDQNMGQGTRLESLLPEYFTNLIMDQDMECTWTPSTVLFLFLLTGSFEEGAWFANKVGQWKSSILIGILSNVASTSSGGLYQFPEDLTPQAVLNAKFNGLKFAPLEDLSIMERGLPDVLIASLLLNVNEVPSMLHHLVKNLKENVSSLTMLVDEDLYLPASPIYSKHKSNVTNHADALKSKNMEGESLVRRNICDTVQRILTLLRGSRLMWLFSVWYYTLLKGCNRVKKHIVQDDIAASLENLRIKIEPIIADAPDLSELPHSVTETFLKIRTFIEILWILHVRDKLSLLTRTCQGSHNKMSLAHEKLTSTALLWVYFAQDFAENHEWKEELQILAVSLAAECKPSITVANALAKIFPDLKHLSCEVQNVLDKLFMSWRNIKFPVDNITKYRSKKQESHAETKPKSPREVSGLTNKSSQSLYMYFVESCKSQLMLRKKVKQVFMDVLQAKQSSSDSCTPNCVQNISDIIASIDSTTMSVVQSMGTVKEYETYYSFSCFVSDFLHDAFFDNFQYDPAQLPLISCFQENIITKELNKIKEDIFLNEFSKSKIYDGNASAIQEITIEMLIKEINSKQIPWKHSKEYDFSNTRGVPSINREKLDFICIETPDFLRMQMKYLIWWYIWHKGSSSFCLTREKEKTTYITFKEVLLSLILEHQRIRLNNVRNDFTIYTPSLDNIHKKFQDANLLLDGGGSEGSQEIDLRKCGDGYARNIASELQKSCTRNEQIEIFGVSESDCEIDGSRILDVCEDVDYLNDIHIGTSTVTTLDHPIIQSGNISSQEVDNASTERTTSSTEKITPEAEMTKGDASAEPELDDINCKKPNCAFEIHKSSPFHSQDENVLNYDKYETSSELLYAEHNEAFCQEEKPTSCLISKEARTDSPIVCNAKIECEKTDFIEGKYKTEEPMLLHLQGDHACSSFMTRELIPKEPRRDSTILHHAKPKCEKADSAERKYNTEEPKLLCFQEDHASASLITHSLISKHETYAALLSDNAFKYEGGDFHPTKSSDRKCDKKLPMLLHFQEPHACTSSVEHRMICKEVERGDFQPQDLIRKKSDNGGITLLHFYEKETVSYYSNLYGKHSVARRDPKCKNHMMHSDKKPFLLHFN